MATVSLSSKQLFTWQSQARFAQEKEPRGPDHYMDDDPRNQSHRDPLDLHSQTVQVENDSLPYSHPHPPFYELQAVVEDDYGD